MSEFFEQGVSIFGMRLDSFALFAAVLAVLLPVIFVAFVYSVAPGSLRFLRLRRMKDQDVYEEVLRGVLAEFKEHLFKQRMEEQSRKKPAVE